MKTKLILSCILLSGCSGFLDLNKSVQTPQTQGEIVSGYTYIPLDPFTIKTEFGEGCLLIDPESPDKPLPIPAYMLSNKGLLAALPDNTVRVSTQSYSAKGNVSYGLASSGAEGVSYRIIVDYINADTTDFPIWMKRQARSIATSEYEDITLFGPIPNGYKITNSVIRVTSDTPNENNLKNWEEYNIPLFVGIGLRATANVTVHKANANISGLGVIGIGAEANTLSGDLVIQTLGVNGQSVSAALPINSELNRTTAQNAVASISVIKALLYDDETELTARLVGMYLPFEGDIALVNAIISELSKNRPIWARICKWKSEESRGANLVN